MNRRETEKERKKEIEIDGLTSGMQLPMHLTRPQRPNNAPATSYKAHFRRSRIHDGIKNLEVPKFLKFLNSFFIKIKVTGYIKLQKTFNKLLNYLKKDKIF